MKEPDSLWLEEKIQKLITKYTEHRDSGNVENVLIVHGATIYKLEEEYDPDAKKVILRINIKSNSCNML